MQSKPDRDIPPPKRPKIASTLRSLKRGESWLFEGGSPGSVQAVMTRIKREYDGARDYTSEWQGNGLRVWRTQ